MINILSVGVGGFIGATLRYLISFIPVMETFIFPIKTFFINILGCMLIAFITIFSIKNISISPQLLLFLKVGICGGFTTFSTFALETTDLLKAGHISTAFIYVFLSILVGVISIIFIEYLSIK